MRKNQRKIQFKKELNLKSIKMYVLSGICGTMAVASIFMTIGSATNGAEVASLQKKQAELLAKQQELQQSLVTALSVNNLAGQSASMGFVKVNNLVYVAESQPVAKLP